MSLSDEQWTRRAVLRGALASASVAAPFILSGCQAPDNPIARASRAKAAAPADTPAAALPTGIPLVEDLTFRRSADRGHADHGWLKAKHSFSFARYQDPAHRSFRSLRVMNEDVISGGGGFPMHPHKDMEILTYVLDGALEHKDSLGSGGVIRPGEVQAMSAGTGIKHSEFNPSGTESVHLLQIWLFPDRRQHTPRYAQKVIQPHTKAEPIRLIASPDGAEQSVMLHQDARIYAVKLEPGQQAFFEVMPSRHAWVQMARGQLSLNRFHTLYQGDGVSTSDSGGFHFSATEAVEFLIFDLA